MGELEVATVPELVAELKKRFTAMVLVAETMPDAKNKDGVFRYYQCGGLSQRMGMCDRIRLEHVAESAACEELEDDPEPEDEE